MASHQNYKSQSIRASVRDATSASVVESPRIWFQRHILISRLPLEVCERIIDCVPSLKVADNSAHENNKLRRNTLVACALTCRAWLFRSRHHLHFSISIYDKVEFDHFVALLNQTPEIASFVVHLTTGTRAQKDKLQEWSHLVPFSLASPLSKLKTVLFNNCDWRNLHPSFLMMTAQFTSVTRMTLQDLKLGSSRELVQLIFSFSSLIELTVRGVECIRNRSCTLRGRSKRCLPLRYLVFRRGFMGYPLLPMLEETSSNHLLTSMDIELTPEEVELQAVGKFLEGCVSLRFMFFCFKLSVNDIDKGLFKHLTLAKSTQLQRLKFELNLSVSNMALLVHMLSTVSVPTVTMIFMRLWDGWNPKPDDKIKTLNSFDWSPLDTVLSSPKFRALRGLCIEVGYLRGSSALRSMLERSLPKLHKRGVLVEELDFEREHDV